MFVDEFQAAFSDAGEAGERGTLSTALASLLDDAAAWNEHSGPESRVTVVGATNEPWAVHPSFLRAGRLERCLFVGALDASSREGMLLEHIKVSVSPDGDERRCREGVDGLVHRTAGFTGADMALLLKKARGQSAGGGLQGLEQAAERVKASVSNEEMEQYKRWTRSR